MDKHRRRPRRVGTRTSTRTGTRTGTRTPLPMRRSMIEWTHMRTSLKGCTNSKFQVCNISTGNHLLRHLRSRPSGSKRIWHVNLKTSKTRDTCPEGEEWVFADFDDSFGGFWNVRTWREHKGSSCEECFSLLDPTLLEGVRTRGCHPV